MNRKNDTHCARHSRLTGTLCHSANDEHGTITELLQRIEGTVKEQHLQDLRTIREVLPVLYRTQQARRVAEERHKALMTAFAQQEDFLLNKLSDEAKEIANEFSNTSFNGMLYRLTTQGKVVAIDLSLVIDIKDEER